MREDKMPDVETLFCAAKGSVTVGQEMPPGKVWFIDGPAFQKWMSLSEVDFAEIFGGFGEATIRVREAGCTAAEGFDNQFITCKRCWNAWE